MGIPKEEAYTPLKVLQTFIRTRVQIEARGTDVTIPIFPQTQSLFNKVLCEIVNYNLVVVIFGI